MPAKVVPLPSARPGPSSPPSPPLGELSDEDLMRLVRAGSREAMTTLAERYVRPLTSFCAKRTGDAGAAEDIVQEVLLRLWRRRAEWQPRGRVKALVYTAALNLCRNSARNSRRRGLWMSAAPLDLEVAQRTAPASDVEELLVRERVRDARRALAELPEPMREALLLRFDAEISYEDIAAIVGAPESTVRSRVHHALLRMRASVREEER
jgi:RNA polymerase sigma-70 factor (ECF subfamily)